MLFVTFGFLSLLHKIFGSVLVLFGAVMLPLPPPFAFGLPMILIGLGLLAPYFKPVQNFVRMLRRKFPKVDSVMRKIKHRCPPVLKATIEKTCPHTTEDSPSA